MCTVSFVMDESLEDWKEKKWVNPIQVQWPLSPSITREEFEQFKKEFELVKRILKRAKLYDEENEEPDCEMQDKVALIRKIAEALGVEIEDVL